MNYFLLKFLSFIIVIVLEVIKYRLNKKDFFERLMRCIKY